MWKNLNSIIQQLGTALRISVGKDTPINIYSKEQVDDLITTGSTDISEQLELKVDKVTNKNLILDSDITKLAGIEAGAEVNINADWNATSGDAQILNKPIIPSIVGLATNSYVDTKLGSYVSKTLPDTITALKTLTNGIDVSSANGNILNVNTQGVYIGNVPFTPLSASFSTLSRTLKSATNPTIPLDRGFVNQQNITLNSSATIFPAIDCGFNATAVINSSNLGGPTGTSTIIGLRNSVSLSQESVPYTNAIFGSVSLAANSSGNSQNWTNANIARGGLIAHLANFRTFGTTSTGTISNATGVASVLTLTAPLITITNAQNYASLNPENTSTFSLINMRGYVGEEITKGTNNTNLLLGTGTSPTGNWNIFSSSSYPNNLGNANTRVGSLTISNTPNVSSSANKVLVRNDATGLIETTTGNSTDANLRDRSTHTGIQAINTITDLQTSLDAKESISNKGIANGYVGLNNNVKIDTAYFPDSILGNLKYGGSYNGSIISASADFTALNGLNLPTTGYAGVYFITTTSFTRAGTNYDVGDWAIHNGANNYVKVDNTDAVTSIHGRLGNVVAVTGDYNTGQITEVTNKKFATDAQLVQIATNTSEIATKEPIINILPILKGGTGSSTKNFVDLTTNQPTIGGIKGFTSPMTTNKISASANLTASGDIVSIAGDLGSFINDTQTGLSIIPTVSNSGESTNSNMLFVSPTYNPSVGSGGLHYLLNIGKQITGAHKEYFTINDLGFANFNKNLTIGNIEENQTTLSLTGGINGGSLLRLNRFSNGISNAYSFSLPSAGLRLSDASNNSVATFSSTVPGAFNSLYLGEPNKTTSDARPSVLSATTFTNAAGANVAGQALYLQGGLGVGTSVPGDVIVYTGNSAATTVLHTTTPRLTIKGGTGAATFTNTVTSTQFRLSALNIAPASATATGTLGEIRVVTGFIYVCIATNTWVRTALTTW